MSIEELLETMRQENAAAHAETRARFAQIDGRFEQIDARFEQIDGRFERIDARFEQIDGRFERIDGRFERIDGRFERIDGRFERIDARFDESQAEVQSLGRMVVEKVDTLLPKIELLAEGINNVNEKLDRETADIRGEMRRGFAETQAMFRYAHADLDRRVRALEEKQ